MVAATVLAGDYPDGYGAVNGVTSRLISPKFIVPSAEQNPRLRLWHWYAFNSGDSGTIQVRIGNGAWTNLASFTSTSGGVWSQPAVSLAAYAGRTVDLGFLFQSSNVYHGGGEGNVEIGPGWYLDELRIETGQYTFPNPESFEGGWGDWSADGGVWEIGRPSSGPKAAHAGQQVAATVLAGDYPDAYGAVDGATSRLISPKFIVPPAEQNPRLRLWQWYAFNSGDSGSIQVRIGNGAWTNLATFASTSGGVWSQTAVSLAAYAGKTVNIGFLFQSFNVYHGGGEGNVEIGPGWYLDEVRIQSDILARVPNQTVVEETLLSVAFSALS